MTRRVAALCLLGVRSVARSRLIIAVLVFLALISAAIRGDGTQSGELRMQLTWTLGIAAVVLGAMSLWAGCSAIASDMESGRHVHTAVSPARPFEVWLGRWLALVLVNAGMLAIVMFALVVQLRIKGFSAEDTAVQRMLEADPAIISEMAANAYAYAEANSLLPAGKGRDEVVDSIIKDLLTTFTPVNPGEMRKWRFMLPAGGEALKMRIRFMFVSTHGGAEDKLGRCQVLDSGGRTIASLEVTVEDNGSVILDIPAVSTGAGAAYIDFLYVNTSDPKEGTAVLVNQVTSARAFVPGGSLAWNMLKCWVALLSMLAFLSAIGVACGTIFSFPVAAFVATAIVVIFMVGQWDLAEADGGEFGHSHSEDGHAPRSKFYVMLDKVSGGMSFVVNKTTEPFVEVEALDRLGDGVALDGGRVTRCFWQVFALQSLLVGVAAAFALRRREL